MPTFRETLEALKKQLGLAEKDASKVRTTKDGWKIEETQKNRPHPELIGEGFKVEAPDYDEPFPYYHDPKRKELYAPFSNFDEYANIRAAEMVGLRITPDLGETSKKGAGKSASGEQKISIDALRAFELIRCAYYAFDLDLMDDPDLSPWVLKSAIRNAGTYVGSKEWQTFSNMISGVAMLPCIHPEVCADPSGTELLEVYNQRMRYLGEGLPEQKKVLDRAMAAFAKDPKSFKSVVEAARIMTEIQPPDDERPKGNRPSRTASEGKTAKDQTKEWTDLVSVIPPMGKFVSWGGMSINRPPLTVPIKAALRGFRYRCTQEGAIPLRLDRLPVDQAIFRSRRHVAGGTALIDHSGSMGLSIGQIQQIIAMLPAATIASYNGSGRQGYLKILAARGRMVAPELLKRDHNGNIVDYPALQWLIKQEGPRIWVTDLGVTGVNDCGSAAAREQCLRLCKREGILIATGLDKAIEFALELRVREEMKIA